MWRSRAFAALFTILSFGSAAAQSRLGPRTQLWMQADRQAAEILVRVIDPQGAAIGNAVVGLLKDAQHIQASGTTNDSGMLRLGELCAGSYTLEVTAQGYPIHRENIKVGSRSVSELQVRLDLPAVTKIASLPGPYMETVVVSGHDTAGIALEVVDPTGAVVPRAKVQLKGKNDKVLAEGVTSEAGSLTLAGLPVGLYTLEVSANGFTVHQESVKTEADKLIRLQVTLEVAKIVYCEPCANAVEIQTSIEPTPIPYIRVTQLPCNEKHSFKRFFGKLFH